MRLACLYLFCVACGGVHSDPQLEHAMAQAGCDAPDGPPHTYMQATELEQLVAGRWIHCSGPLLLDHGEQGIEFLADHSYFGLVLDSSGTLQRQLGFDFQGSWVALQLSPSDVELSYTAGEGQVRLEDDPVRFAIPIESEDNLSIYARVE